MQILTIYAHGWTSPVTNEDISKRFTGIPGITRISRVDINRKHFAHVDLEINESPEEVLAKLKQTYKNAKWKGGVLEFECGRPNYILRLQQEKMQNVKDKETEIVKPLSNEEIELLRIRGVGRSPKKPKVIVFTEDEAICTPIINPQPYPMSIPLSQDLAYCCTTGDAGPIEDTSVAPLPISSQSIIGTLKNEKTELTTKENTNEEEGPSLLSEFVNKNIVIPSNLGRRKHAAKSLLGIWFARNPKSKEAVQGES